MQFDSMINFIIMRSRDSGIVQRLLLFGSRAKGTSQDKSDYDFAFELDLQQIDVYLKWGRLAMELNEFKPRLNTIDLVRLDEVSDEFKNKIFKEGIVLYNKAHDKT